MKLLDRLFGGPADRRTIPVSKRPAPPPAPPRGQYPPKPAPSPLMRNAPPARNPSAAPPEPGMITTLAPGERAEPLYAVTRGLTDPQLDRLRRELRQGWDAALTISTDARDPRLMALATEARASLRQLVEMIERGVR